ncbi:uncharacterized protein LOC111062302 [Nilaparvata lugens]|uniref:uncharacterized protein LOC111062302 n=1 Tax=Nilaparvata lugens TaxID=108931 RepID=UPI00193CB7D6|nr:uncharacterized protein LOC111062302 [Nilaparvata lugens]
MLSSCCLPCTALTHIYGSRMRPVYGLIRHTSTAAVIFVIIVTLISPAITVHAATVREGRDAAGADELPEFTEACLGCICDATSACNLTIGCTAGLCGPFLIGRQYWFDAGAPVLSGDNWQRSGAYEACTVDPYCSTSTMYNYMSRYIQDCNGDGEITCDDYARIHYLGGLQCDMPIHNYAYYRVFRQCVSKIANLK